MPSDILDFKEQISCLCHWIKTFGIIDSDQIVIEEEKERIFGSLLDNAYEKDLSIKLQRGTHQEIGIQNQCLFDKYITNNVTFGVALPINKTAVIDILKCLIQSGGGFVVGLTACKQAKDLKVH